MVLDREGVAHEARLLRCGDFAAVGELHLDGPNCVYELLRRALGVEDRAEVARRFELGIGNSLCQMSLLVIRGGEGSKDDAA